MQVEIHLHGLLRLLVSDPDGHHTVELPDRSPVAELIKHFGARDLAWLVAINGEAASRDAVLKSGDRVDVYPCLEGG
jgi:sulfur carrier protein ThiS